MRNDAIILIGMAGVGKSTIGRLLAQALCFEFTDLDEYILQRDGKTVHQIVDEEGDEALVQREGQRLRELDLTRRVVAPGGSIVYNPDLMEWLKPRALLVYLADSFENIEKRLTNAASRGIVGFKSKSLKQIYAEREPLYVRYADITVALQGRPEREVAREIVSRYLQSSAS